MYFEGEAHLLRPTIKNFVDHPYGAGLDVPGGGSSKARAPEDENTMRGTGKGGSPKPGLPLPAQTHPRRRSL